MAQYILGVGSNIEPRENVRRSAEILAAEHKLLGESNFITTSPVGFQDQDDFLNGAFLIESELGYEDLNRYLKEVEKRLGRVKGPIKSGPRTIDLDIIIMDGKIMHDDYHTADYTRIPVREIIERFEIKVRES